MKANLDTLTAFHNRFFQSSTGVQAAQWVFDTLTGIAAGKPGITVTKFIHTSWVQFSVIVKIPGTKSGPVTILGCHLDSINQKDRMNGRAPGADDVGSTPRPRLQRVLILLLGRFRSRQCR